MSKTFTAEIPYHFVDYVKRTNYKTGPVDVLVIRPCHATANSEVIKDIISSGIEIKEEEIS